MNIYFCVPYSHLSIPSVTQKQNKTKKERVGTRRKNRGNGALVAAPEDESEVENSRKKCDLHPGPTILVEDLFPAWRLSDCLHNWKDLENCFVLYLFFSCESQQTQETSITDSLTLQQVTGEIQPLRGSKWGRGEARGEEGGWGRNSRLGWRKGQQHVDSWGVSALSDRPGRTTPLPPSL